MSKDNVKALIKLIIQGAAANPAPPVGSSLGQQGVNIMDFCKQFNARTANRKGEAVPVLITVYKDKSFTFITKTTPTSELIRKKLNLSKGSATPNKTKVGSLNKSQLEEIAKIKMEDLNTRDVEAACKIVAGTARSMGIEISI